MNDTKRLADQMPVAVVVLFKHLDALRPPTPPPRRARTGSVEGQRARENDGPHGPHGQPGASARACARSACAISCRAHLVARACGDPLAVVVVRDMVDAGLVARRHLAGRLQRRRSHGRTCSNRGSPPLVRSAGASPDVACCRCGSREKKNVPAAGRHILPQTPYPKPQPQTPVRVYVFGFSILVRIAQSKETIALTFEILNPKL